MNFELADGQNLNDRKPRDGWEEQFRLMAERGDVKLIDEYVATTWESEEWEWSE